MTPLVSHLTALLIYNIAHLLTAFTQTERAENEPSFKSKFRLTLFHFFVNKICDEVILFNLQSRMKKQILFTLLQLVLLRSRDVERRLRDVAWRYQRDVLGQITQNFFARIYEDKN